MHHRISLTKAIQRIIGPAARRLNLKHAQGAVVVLGIRKRGFKHGWRQTVLQPLYIRFEPSYIDLSKLDQSRNITKLNPEFLPKKQAGQRFERKGG
jgi:hypothetical protein